MRLPPFPEGAAVSVLAEIAAERTRQDAKWGEQNPPNGTGGARLERLAVDARECCDEEFAADRGTWSLILHEEVAEALAEADPEKLRTELVQVAAVAVSWVECIDRKAALSS